MRALRSRGLAEVDVEGAVVDVDALVGEHAVGDREDRAGVDRGLGPVREAPDASCQTLISGCARRSPFPSRVVWRRRSRRP